MTNAETKEYVSSLARDLSEKMAAERFSDRTLAASLGLDKSAVCRARAGKPVKVETFLQLQKWLGRELLERRASDKPSEAVAWVQETPSLAVATIQPDGFSMLEITRITGKTGFGLTIHRQNEDAGRWEDMSIALSEVEASALAATLTTQPAESAKSGDGVTITDERIERAARAIMERDVCGYCVHGVRCFCDDALVQGELDGYGQPLRQSVCGCKEAAKVALTAALGDHRND